MTDTRDITRRAVAILRDGDAAGAVDLALRHADLPEALMVFNTAGLDAAQKSQMSKAINGAGAGIHARLGALCFSFPLWRFPAQAEGGTSLLEQFGMRRLSRPTDLRDAALPDPARDEFGTGFVWQGYGTVIEYRRAYMLCATDDAALIVRNSSYFFGRDRLAAPVYMSFGGETPESLQALTRDDIETRFSPWNEVPPEKTRLAENLVARLDAFEGSFQSWMHQDGLPAVQNFLRARLAAGRAMPHIGTVDAAMPPWFPQNVRALDDGVIDALGGAPFAMLSGPNGDLPAI